MTDDHHDNSYEDTGEIASVRAHIAYAEWRGPDFDPEYLRDAADMDRKRRRENGIPNPLVDAWVASQTGPLCEHQLGTARCVLRANHEGGCFLRTPLA